jgi:hypothetical protein
VLNNPPDRALLFQYGSNMSEQRLTAKVRQHQHYAPAGVDLDVRLLGCARLKGWRFILDLYSARQSCLVGDIVEADQSDEVWGALYEVDRQLLIRSDGGRSVLDRIEGHRTEVDPENYRPITVTVELLGEQRAAHTYVGADDARRRCRSDHPDAKPREDYVTAILDGVRAVALPPRYLRALDTTLQAELDRASCVEDLG